MFTLLLIGMLTLISHIKTGSSTVGKIYIKPDGSINPPTAPIQRVGSTYTFTANIYNYSIIVQKNSITIDGNNYNLQADGTSMGFSLSTISGVTIKNLKIKGFAYGIYLFDSTTNTITSNTITNNTIGGIALYYSPSNTISYNTIKYNREAVYLHESPSCTIQNNTITNNDNGLMLIQSGSCTLTQNTLTTNQYNFGVDGLSLSDFIQNIDTTNLADGKIIRYLINKKDITINPTTYPNTGYLALVNSTKITIKDLEITKNRQGLLLASTTNSNVTNLKTSNNYAGIYLWNSNSTTLRANIAIYNYDGITMQYSNNNIITNNTITNNKDGISPYNSNNNLIHHNNFIDNENNVYTQYSTNTWDNGYPSGGNYWSDYNGTDLKKGPNQDQSGSDGIGDTPYIIDDNNRDRYPLMKPIEVHDIAITDIIPSKTVIGQKYSASIGVIIKNQGSFSETFNLSIYANTSLIQTKTTTLPSLGSATVTFSWNTSGWTKGVYTLNAYAAPVPSEVDTSDNSLTNGMVKVTVPGDVDGDRDIDIYDVVRIASVYGTKIGEPRYIPNCDINGDGEINIYDVVIATSRYGYKE
jgi:parallel beta-helix repeat protein